MEGGVRSAAKRFVTRALRWTGPDTPAGTGYECVSAGFAGDVDLSVSAFVAFAYLVGMQLTKHCTRTG